MPSHHQQIVVHSNDQDALQAWKAFSLAFWDEPGYGVDEAQQRELFHAGFLRSRWQLYELHEHGMDGYLSDFQALCLQTANVKYQTVLADWLLCSHVMANYFHVPTTYCVVGPDNVQWLALPWWEPSQKPAAALQVHPLHAAPQPSLRPLPLPDIMNPTHERQRLAQLKEQARKHGRSLVVSDAAATHPELVEMAGEGLLHVLLVREPQDWLPELVAATLVLGRRSAHGEGLAQCVEQGALSVRVDPETGLLTSCKALNDAGELESLSHHPDTGVELLGQSLPGWEQARQTLLCFFDEASYLRICHLTFAVTEEGLSFMAAHNDQLAAHQMHQPLLDYASIEGHLKRLGD